MTSAGLDAALRAIAAQLARRAAVVLAANADDVRAAKAEGLADGLRRPADAGRGRVEAMAEQLRTLADIACRAGQTFVRELPDGLELHEWRRPVGVIGANFEARPNVVVDIASQLIKSRNAGVLRTGSSAIGSAAVLIDEVVGPAMAASGLDPAAIQLVRVPGRDTAVALVRQPRADPARHPARQRRQHARAGARGSAARRPHAGPRRRRRGDLHRPVGRHGAGAAAHRAQPGPARRLQPAEPAARRSARSGTETVPAVTALADKLGIAVSLPPHAHPLGHEWALDAGAEATITLAPAAGRGRCGRDRQPRDVRTGRLDRCRRMPTRPGGSSTPTREPVRSGTRPRACSTGSSCCRVPETGINIDVVPGPRGPVTFRDLYLRQYVVVPRRARR